MTKEKIIDNIARLNSETWRDREEVRTEIGKLLAELKKSLEQQPSEDCVSRHAVHEMLENIPIGVDDKWFNWLQKASLRLMDLPPVTPTFPKGATNGDMIKAMFPSVEVKEKNNGYEVYFGIGTASQYFNHQWWNAPYNEDLK